MLDRLSPRGQSRAPQQNDPQRQDVVTFPPASGGPIDAAEYERRLYAIFELPPISPVLLDVFYMAKSDQTSAEQLAANIARDAFLATEVLRMASSAYYNPSGRHIGELRLAVARLGRRTIAALALSRHMLGKSWSGWSHLVDPQLAWRQSIGAGVAVEMILEQGGRQVTSDELFLCALMHALGRMILLSLFPEVYETLVENARRQQSTLLSEELRVFPESHSATMQRLLHHWGIARAVHAPLQYFTNNHDEIRLLNEPLRSQVEAVKLAALIGRIAAGTWQQWEQIEFPPEDVLARLGLRGDALAKIIAQTTSDTEMLCRFGMGDASVPSECVSPSQLPLAYSLTYQHPTADFDWLWHLMPAAGLRAERFTTSGVSSHPTIGVDSTCGYVLVNGTKMVRLPCSFALLQLQLVRLAQVDWQSGAVEPSAKMQDVTRCGFPNR